MLTDREREVLRLLACGLYATEVPAQIHFSIRTVKQILHDVRIKLGARTTTHAVVLAIKQELL